MRFPRRLAAHLENGTLVPPAFAIPIANAYAALCSPFLSRPVRLPSHVPVIGIGSAVLGGAGKTAVAIAYAQSLARSGARVALVAHGYGCRQVLPLCCSGNEPAQQVGDDTLVAAHALRFDGVCVWVGRDRNDTLRAAAKEADVLILDGVLQTRPHRLARSVLVLDATHPFGAGACPPAGDMRGPFDELAQLCDEVVMVRDALSPMPPAPAPGTAGLVRTATVNIPWIACGDDRMSVESVAGRRVGLLTFLARPDRILSSLLLRGIRPVCAWHGADHGTPTSLQRGAISKIAVNRALEGWIVTTKCGTHVTPKEAGAPLFVLEVTTRLDPTPCPVLDSPPCVPQDSSSSC